MEIVRYGSRRKLKSQCHFVSPSRQAIVWYPPGGLPDPEFVPALAHDFLKIKLNHMEKSTATTGVQTPPADSPSVADDSDMVEDHGQFTVLTRPRHLLNPTHGASKRARRAVFSQAKITELRDSGMTREEVVKRMNRTAEDGRFAIAERRKRMDGRTMNRNKDKAELCE
ncbi:hypothetical protein CONLIGDRAFT_685757 [Coniochaeta ligniaria NRRL 30616]|uniref:Uncharacterized protein n=1 Tax=Coniochaeta ligniaria NRRL 30616 TaxID=1408157 RepID=A0A1J7J4Q8_9PEZI|nr:hypothetical protein CONLIGDRAFT_685757 [Coniochaeta ligniaria NRRL 30616]